MRGVRKWLFIAIAVSLAVTIAHDASIASAVTYRLNGDARLAAEAGAAAAAKDRQDPKSGWPATYAASRTYGFTVTGYAQDQQRVIVDTVEPVPGTWIMGPIAALIARQPLRTPMHVSSRAEVLY